jgi:hypothetical protein
VARRPDLIDAHQQRVAVAVERDGVDVLRVERDQNVARPVVSVRCSASSSIQPTISTSPVSCCCTTAATRPAASRLSRAATAGSSPDSARGVPARSEVLGACIPRLCRTTRGQSSRSLA